MFFSHLTLFPPACKVTVLMPGRTFLGVLAAALVGGALAGAGDQRDRSLPPRPATPPNVLLIVVDTLRADHLGSYGYERDTSPYLDGLARAGTRFVSARAPSSWTGASVASLLTGLSPIEHGLEHHNSFLPDAQETMPEAFQNAGYETVAFSANPAFVTPEMGFAQGFDRFDVLHGKHVSRNTPGDVHWGDASMLTLVEVATAQRVTETAIAWLAERSTDRPFLAYLHYFDPHAGYYPPSAFAERFGVPADEPLRGPSQKQFVYRHMRDVSGTTAPELETLVALYDAEIAFTDLQIGRVLLETMARKIGPTVIIVTSDHGEEFGEHGGLQHSRTLFEELVHVPLIISGAGVPGNATVEVPASLLDVWPLLADLTGVPAPPHLRSQSLHELVYDPPPRPPFFADLAVSWGIHTSAVIADSSKLIVDLEGSASLYDLTEDPEERRDAARHSPARADALSAAIRTRRAHARTSPTHNVKGRFVLTPKRRARLEALGYLE